MNEIATDATSAPDSAPVADTGNEIASTPAPTAPSPSQADRGPVDLDQAGGVPLGTFDMPSGHSQQRQRQEKPTRPDDLPRSWPTADAEFWAQRSPEARSRIVDRENDRERTFRRQANEAAEARKSYEAALQQAQAAQQNFAA